MLGLIGYMIGCLVIAGVITVVLSAFRPIHGQGDSKSWHILIGSFLVCLAGPYVYAEVMTAMHGEDMEDTVEDVLWEEDILGDLQYYKVLSGGEGGARVIAVSLDDNGWGGEERAVVAMTLIKDEDGWRAEKSNVVTSFRQGKDFSTLPPYW